MRIAVCIKQVPVVSALAFEPSTKTLRREGVPNEVSSFDVRALLKAVELKAALAAEVVVMTMGPPQARDALIHCLALGADRAVHLCDRAFAGADTLATARALALALRREAADLILCGRYSVDAETGQVGPEIAELLDIPQITGARSLAIDATHRQLTAERETDDGFETVTASLPALVTAAEDLSPERFPSKADRAAAATKPIIELRAAELSSDPSQFGAAGSPTSVAELHPVEAARLGRVIETESVDAAAAQLAQVLVEEHGLFGRWKVREQPALAAVATAPPRHGAADVWVLGEELRGEIRPVVCELLGKATTLARALRSTTSVVLLGHDVERHTALLAAYGADRVVIADDPRLIPYHTEVHAALLADAIRFHAPGIVLVPATVRGRDLAPRVAARLDLGLTGDCIDIGLDAQGRLLQYKPAFGGSVVAPIRSRTVPELATVRPGMLSALPPDHHRRASITRLAVTDLPSPRVRVLAQQPAAEHAGELDHAEIVIGIGKGLGDKTHLARLQPLIELLHAAVCTTRDVADAGWLPRQQQVGLTGRAIAPQLYIAVAIRGAFEHMVGVRRAGLVVAINKNRKAPIFKHADYGVVGDYADVVPALYQHLSRARARSGAG